VVRTRIDRKAAAVSLPGAIGVRRNGRKVLLALRNMGGESTAAWSALLEDMTRRGLKAPAFIIVDGAPGQGALAALWPDVPVQRRTGSQAPRPARARAEAAARRAGQWLPRHDPRRDRRRRGDPPQGVASRKWRLRRRAAADSLEEAGDRLFTFTRLPPGQWKSGRTPSAVERLREEFRRRIKTQAVLPGAETAPMPFRALLASGRIVMRKVDGWETLAEPLRATSIDLAAWSRNLRHTGDRRPRISTTPQTAPLPGRRSKAPSDRVWP
jgi:putative transposase